MSQLIAQRTLHGILAKQHIDDRESVIESSGWDLLSQYRSRPVPIFPSCNHVVERDRRGLSTVISGEASLNAQQIPSTSSLSGGVLIFDLGLSTSSSHLSGLGVIGAGLVRACAFGAGSGVGPVVAAVPTEHFYCWTGSVDVSLKSSDHVFESESSASEAGVRRVERISDIQASFGFSTQALADVLGVSRANLYKWLDPAKEISLQGASRERLAAIERLAARWRELSAAPLTAVAYEQLESGQTPLQLLSEEELNEAAISKAFAEAARRLKAKPKSLTQRMADAGFTRRSNTRSVSDDE